MYTYVRNGKRASDGRIFLKGGTEKRDGINHASHSDSICIPHQIYASYIKRDEIITVTFVRFGFFLNV